MFNGPTYRLSVKPNISGTWEVNTSTAVPVV
jgi:hypothetical protein